ncbi:SCO0930 family lipoprotein [Prauserella muralis]|uniref:Uncharacterized protein n=1 Tax=Prauserella muralis TaxID=588067 RepID=A0A2V4B1N6_9PSEU|nr:SCO0930 family lipoprotein [Prauserella muralis]PXY28181.1 hypothetical protein BAY60_17790 [Prauserella muralis]TWE22005.1 putative lipoprotein with Yx(FWY)xxD motif [Prauserella muralis]
MSRRSLAALTVAAVAGIGLLGACGDGTDGSSGTGRTTPVAVQQQAQAESTSATATLVAVADVAGLGAVLTDGDGRTLYRFSQDTADPPQSHCDGECAAAWPPLIAKDGVAVDGLSSDVVGTVRRADGTEQVTVKGWPVYTYAQDAEPGESTGHGAGDGQWSAISPTGATVGQASAPSSSARDRSVAVATTRIGGLGTVLTDGEGRTLYLFTEDGTKPPAATCAGECAEAWPPVIADGDVEITGVDPDLVGTVTRPDGTEQVTVGGWPMYTYARDAGPGDAAGHGVKGTWFAVETNGCAVAADKRPTGSAASEDAGDGY